MSTPLSLKHERPTSGELPSTNMVKKQRTCRKVLFAEGAKLEDVHYFDPFNDHNNTPIQNDDLSLAEGKESEADTKPKLTEELTLLSTLHGQARRELRDISKHDLQTAMKYGVKTRARTVNGERRWKFEFGNCTFITNYECTTEITCYKNAIQIKHANITKTMRENHEAAVRMLKDDPHLCTTHSIIIIDQSGSMRTCDVNGFRSRSAAAFGTLALDYIAEQLYQQGDEFFVDAVTIVKMTDTGSILFHKEPLDWILFNKILTYMENAKPKSHGNYVESLEVAEKVIQDELDYFRELDADDIPAFTLVFISDGRPSDNLPDQKGRRNGIMTRLANTLKSKLTFLGMGIGSSGSDFAEMQLLADIVTSCDAEGEFVHAGLNATSISTTLTSVATSLTAARNDLLSKRDQKTPKTEKVYTMKHKNCGKVQVRRETNSVTRYLYDTELSDSYPWRKVNFINNGATGFEMEKNPFGLGAERLAYLIYEIQQKACGWERVGRALVAKESRYLHTKRRIEGKISYHLL